MRARGLVTAVLLSLLGWALVPVAARGDDPEKAAVAAADAWLRLVDAGKYGASWDEAARLFRDAVGKPDWERSVKNARAPFGRLVSRKVSARTYTESLPGAPDGKYVVVQYETSFENKKRATETVTPMLDDDGRWRVSGYFIK
jgi:hypothetical protein